ncbi:MAG: chromosomal replication initiator protein DnaA [Erysipelotrichaceae bacterium]|nr:chromosomal replication initiator protein DnaA [Erysipelotrichaceae bacterium]MDY5252574.1 chromosomal replication initiator protein DnaA [Erysipelotrichaceae bacterium]
MSIDNTLFFKDIWTKVIKALRENQVVDEVVLTSFFESTSIYELNESKCILLVPSIIHKSLIASHSDYIKNELEQILNITGLEIDILQEKDLQDRLNTAMMEELEKPPVEVFEGELINKQLTFDNFIVGKCNRESHAAALACAVDPGKFFNPLFIYGNSGLGKTHLLSAIANYIHKQDPRANIFYVGTLKFVEMVVDCLKTGRIDAFKKYMYSVDVLLIDDVQFLAGKDKMHEIFFTIFNELVNNRKQIVIASDRLPQDIKGLEDRLITRFSSGLSIGIDSPEFETSVQMLKSKLSNSVYSDASFDEDVFSFIASNFNRNVRDLEGALNRVIFYAIQFQQDGGRIKLETAMQALKGQTTVKEEKTKLTVKKIIKTVADYYGLTPQQIVSKSRTGPIANARHISIYLSRKLLDLSYIKIGEEFGGRDHSTIISSCTKVEKLNKNDTFYAQALKEIEGLIKN